MPGDELLKEAMNSWKRRWTEHTLKDSPSSGGRQRAALVVQDTCLCLGKGCYTTGLCFPKKEQRERGRGQHWKIRFVGKIWFITGESEASTGALCGDVFVLGSAGCPVTVQMLSCEFFFLQKIQTLLGLHSAAQNNRGHTGKPSRSSLCLDISAFSDFTLPNFHSRTSRKTFFNMLFSKHFGHYCFFSHPRIEFFCYMELFLSYSSWYQLTQSYFGILKKLYHKLCLVCVWIVSKIKKRSTSYK